MACCEFCSRSYKIKNNYQFHFDYLTYIGGLCGKNRRGGLNNRLSYTRRNRDEFVEASTKGNDSGTDGAEREVIADHFDEQSENEDCLNIIDLTI